MRLDRVESQCLCFVSWGKFSCNATEKDHLSDLIVTHAAGYVVLVREDKKTGSHEALVISISEE